MPKDHRQLGRALKLFDSYQQIGPGLPIWLPDGAVIRSVLEQYALGLERRAGYCHVYSPVLAKRELYEQSGHWQHYHDDIFPPMRIGNDDVVLRPMLCPHHVLVYKSEPRSHRQLPVRVGEIGGQYRNEASGSLGGLSRVRAMVLNDGHLFCREDQIEAEISASLSLIARAAHDLGVAIANYRLSLRGPGKKYVDKPDLWEKSQAVLLRVLQDMQLPFVAAEDEAAFYGPKIDVQVQDVRGREISWTTVQLDFLLPERFDLRYVDAKGDEQRPVMVHRSIIGGLERVVAYLIERWQGVFPFWLAPVQLMIVPVDRDRAQHAEHLSNELIDLGIRAQVDHSDGSLGERLHAIEQHGVPFAVILGNKEIASAQVSLRSRDGRRIDSLSRSRFMLEMKRLDSDRRLDLNIDESQSSS